MFGPSFLLEWKYAARRCRHRSFRAYYTLLLAAEFCLFLWAWLSRGFDPLANPTPPWRLTALVIADYLPLFALQHLLLVLLVTPALAAGSVSDEKNRGTFTLLFTTRVSAGEIVLSKWLGQTVQMLVLALPVLPLIAYMHGMLGVSAATMVAWAAESALLVMLLAALCLLASVWARRTVTAIVAAYLVLLVALAGAWWAGVGGVLEDSALITPLYAPVDRGIGAGWPRLMLAAAALTAACLTLAAWRLRPACTAERARRPRARRCAWLDRPAVGAAPVRWKERYIGELGLFAFARKLPRWGLLGLALGVGLVAARLMPGSDDAFTVHGIAMIFVVCLFVALRSSAVVAREREHQTWEPLLITPLEPRELVRGKLWGILDSIKLYMLAYLVGALVWAIPNGWWPAFITCYCWLAAWGFLYFHAANGVYWSARSANSVKAMLCTLATGWIAILWNTSFLVVLLAIAVGACVLGGIGAVVTPASIAGVMLVFAILPLCLYGFAGAEERLQLAEKHIAETDRVLQVRRHRGHAIDPDERVVDLGRRRSMGVRHAPR